MFSSFACHREIHGTVSLSVTRDLCGLPAVSSENSTTLLCIFIYLIEESHHLIEESLATTAVKAHLNLSAQFKRQKAGDSNVSVEDKK